MTQPSIWEFMEGVFLMDKTESKKQIKYLKKKKTDNKGKYLRFIEKWHLNIKKSKFQGI